MFILVLYFNIICCKIFIIKFSFCFSCNFYFYMSNFDLWVTQFVVQRVLTYFLTLVLIYFFNLLPSHQTTLTMFFIIKSLYFVTFYISFLTRYHSSYFYWLYTDLSSTPPSLIPLQTTFFICCTIYRSLKVSTTCWQLEMLFLTMVKDSNYLFLFLITLRSITLTSLFLFIVLRVFVSPSFSNGCFFLV